MKIKNLIKRAVVSLMAIGTTFTSTSSFLPTKAASHSVTTGTGMGYTYNVTNADGVHSVWDNNAAMIYIDGEVGFCVQPGYELQTGNTFSSSTFSSTLSRELSVIAYEGWENSSKTNEDWLATQFYIWETLGATINSSNFLSKYNSTYKSAIKARVTSHNTKPSFNGGSYELNVGESITLTDTNGVLSDFYVYSNGGATVTKSGNKLTITATSSTSENTTIQLLKIPQSKQGISLVYDNGSQDIAKFYLQDPIPATIKIKVNKTGSLKITKQDEDGTKVANTTFKLSANSDMSSPIGTYTTGSDGTVTISDLLAGTYYVQETSVPSNLNLDSTIYKVTIEANQTTSYVATNTFKKGYIQVTKTDADTGKTVTKANTTFSIYKSDGTFVEDVTTNNDGIALSSALTYGDYYLIEKTAPNGYLGSSQKITYQIRENEKVYTVEISNKRVTGSLTMTKVDSVTGSTAQGEATLEGAVYGLYARENIVDPADGSVIYKAGTLIKELTTDENGEASVSNLYLGKYYVKEISASNGYTLDTTEYDVTLSYKDQNTSVVTQSVTVKERVISQAFQIIKISDNNAGEADIVEGAEFTIKSQADIDKYGSWEAAPIAKNANGEEASVLVTDKNGYAVSDELPYGTYVVRETKVPEDMYQVDDFTVTISEDSRDPQAWRVFNDVKFRAVIEIVKEDAETGETVAVEGATFKIKNLTTGEYVGYWAWFPLPHYVTEWSTSELGTVMTGDVLDPGEYQLEEVIAPDGYLINTEPVTFKISMNTAYETLPDGTTPVITVKMQDTSVKGQINISKIGEVLTNIEIDKEDNSTFIYTQQELADAVYGIYAAEDIKSASQNHIVYEKDTLVEKVVTDDEGSAESMLLPLGKYYIKELKAPNGYVLSDEIQYVELTYEDQTTPIIFENITFINNRQQIELSIFKIDSETETPLQGARFGLYANEDIINITGDILIEKDQLIETVISNENGELIFNTDLPLSTYYIKELESPTGYASSQEIYMFDASYQGQNIPTISFYKTFKNDITKVEVSKKDSITDEELEGALLIVYSKDDEDSIFDSWISGQDGKNEDGTVKTHIIKGLEVGKTYVLKEISAPYGYTILTEEIEFTVSDTADIQYIELKNERVTEQLVWDKTIIMDIELLPIIDSPQTGDNTKLKLKIYYTLATVSAVCIVFCYYQKKKNKNC